jgi:hypothetical protein
MVLKCTPVSGLAKCRVRLRGLLRSPGTSGALPHYTNVGRQI